MAAPSAVSMARELQVMGVIAEGKGIMAAKKLLIWVSQKMMEAANAKRRNIRLNLIRGVYDLDGLTPDQQWQVIDLIVKHTKG